MGGEVTIFLPYSAHSWNPKLLKLKIDLTTRTLPQLIRVPFLAEMLGAILFFVWFQLDLMGTNILDGKRLR
jgi:hypothetical protein